MGKLTHSRGFFGAGAAAAVWCFLVAGWLAAADHPRLVSVSASKCSVCHSKLTRGAAVIHPPVEDDCTSCHEVSVTDSGTTVELAAPEPGLCVMCHDGLERAAEGELAAPHAPVTDSCLNCHDPHAASEEALLSMPKGELCLGCHDIEDLMGAHGGQLTKAVECSGCHQAHGSDNPKMILSTVRHSPFEEGSCEACHREPFAGRIRLRARGEKVCSACHGDFRDEIGAGGSIHGALESSRTRAGCLSCHNPHMSPNGTLLVATGVDLCGECHEGIVRAAGADTGHAPAAEDCTTCHGPHVSENPSLLVENPPDLCLMCHDPDDEDLQDSHLGAPMAGLDCVTCHTPHGDGNEHLLAENVHPPILDGCDICHEGSHEQLMVDGESDLCLACHDDIGEAAAAAAVPHAALEMARCVDCHNPHASPQHRLVNVAAGGECTTCHEDIAAGPDEVAHGVIDLLGCRACHEPHGGANEKLLRMVGSDLCLECHDSSRVEVPEAAETVALLDRFEVPAASARAAVVLNLGSGGEHGHPVQGHRTLGTPTKEELARTETTFEGELVCLSCHNPHKGRTQSLLAGGAASTFELCGTCHPK